MPTMLSRRTALVSGAGLILALGGCGATPAVLPPPGTVRTVPGPAPAGRPTTTRVGTNPTAVAVGFGAVWVANNTDGTVDRLDAATGRLRGPAISVGPGPLAVTTGEGGVWVATGDGYVRRLDPRTGRVTHGGAQIDGLAGLAAGEGAVWATSSAAGTLTRIDPRTGRVRGKPLQVGRGPTDVAVGAGSVWVADSTAGHVVRVDPRSVRVAGRTPVAHAQPAGQVLALTFGEGAVWVAKTDARLAQPIDLVRLDPSTGRTSGAPLRISGRVGLRLAAGAGAVWATDAGNALPPVPRRRPTVLRVDPRRQALAGPAVPVGLEPSGVAVGAGAVWITNAGDNSVTRVAP